LDDHRTVAKSRMPTTESRRVDLDLHKEVEAKTNGLFQSSSSADNGSVKLGTKRARDETNGDEYDHEVYDDRMFYAMLLKVKFKCNSPVTSLCLTSHFPLLYTQTCADVHHFQQCGVFERKGRSGPGGDHACRRSGGPPAVQEKESQRTPCATCFFYHYGHDFTRLSPAFCI